MARRSKPGKILVRIGADAQKRAARNEAIAKAQRDRAIRKAAKIQATALRRNQRAIARRAMQLARKLARDRATQARREAKRERDRQRRQNGDRPKRKRPFHPRGPYATKKYTSRSRRVERSKSLRPRKLSATLFQVGSWLVTARGNIPICCNCPDFTQKDGRSWEGSAAGPFICKHMLSIKSGVIIPFSGMAELGNTMISFSGEYIDLDGFVGDLYQLDLSTECDFTVGCGGISPSTIGPYYQGRLKRNGTVIYTWGPTGWYSLSISGARPI